MITVESATEKLPNREFSGENTRKRFVRESSKMENEKIEREKVCVWKLRE